MPIRFVPCTNPLFALPVFGVEDHMEIDHGVECVLSALRRQFAAQVHAVWKLRGYFPVAGL